MAVYVIKMFGISLGLTLLIELAVTFLLKEWSGKNALLVTLVNVITNLTVVLIAWYGSYYIYPAYYTIVQIPLEIGVIFVEGLIYWLFSQEEQWNIKKPIRLAIVANVVSWVSGVILQMI